VSHTWQKAMLLFLHHHRTEFIFIKNGGGQEYKKNILFQSFLFEPW
jgi:hypothetical protein